MRRVMLVLAIAALFADAAYGADEVKVTGKIEAVTLYRGQALVTRVVAFDAPAGAVQLVVEDLPDRVMPQSLHASTGDGLRVRAVRFRATARKEAPKAEVRELDKTIRGIEMKLRQNASNKRLADQQEADLNSLRNFVVPSAKVEMAKGVLNVDTLQKVNDMMTKRRADLAKTKLEIDENARTLREELTLLARKRSELTRSSSKTAREAVVFLDKAAAGKGQIRLSYLVSDATWEPVYNLRVAGEKTKANVEYTAIARQMTGEDWTDVKLTLSAAVAQMVADGPALAPLRVRLTKTREQLGRAQVEERLKQSQRQLQTLNWQNTSYQGQASQMDNNWKMNQSSWAYQGIELAAREGYGSLIQDAGGIGRTASLSANYKLEGRVTFASRRENQTIEIARFDLPAKFHYEAVPLLTEYVFRYARLTNSSNLALLQGKSTVYLDGSFVGIGTVPMMARGQQATVGFGMDPQLRAAREFVAKKESDEWIGKNRLTKFSYRLVLHNYSDKAVTVRLLGRTPVPTDVLKVEITKTSEPLSKDAEYVRTQRPRGILRWEVAVPAKTAPTKPKLVNYTYTLAHHKDLHISVGEPPAAAAAEMKVKFMKKLREGRR